MTQLLVNQVTKEIAGEKLFAIAHLHVDPGDRIGIIGKNGGGKTTLLQMMSGADQDYTGEIKRAESCGFVPQLKEGTTESGGELVRAYLNEALKKRSELLFLDEPTANLDEENQMWLLKKLKRYAGTIIFVTHDRRLLSELATAIWEVEDRTFTAYSLDYQAFLKVKAAEIAKKAQAFTQYQQEKKKLETEIQKRKQKAEQMQKAPKGMSTSEAKARSLAGSFDSKQRKMASTAKSLERRKEKLPEAEKVTKTKAIKLLDRGLPRFDGKTILRTEQLPVTAGGRLLIEKATFVWKDKERIALVGQNQSGKTTFIKQLLRSNNNHIKVSSQAKIGYFSQDFQTVDLQKTIFANAQAFSTQPAQVIFDLLGALGFRQAKVLQKADSLSGGERVRLGLAQILASDSNALILDEPTNYLDLQALEALENFLLHYQGGILLVSHDQTFVERVATKKWRIESKQLVEVETDVKSVASAALTGELQRLRLHKEAWIADSSIPIEKVQHLNEEIAELEKQVAVLESKQ